MDYRKRYLAKTRPIICLRIRLELASTNCTWDVKAHGHLQMCVDQHCQVPCTMDTIAISWGWDDAVAEIISFCPLWGPGVSFLPNSCHMLCPSDAIHLSLNSLFCLLWCPIYTVSFCPPFVSSVMLNWVRNSIYPVLLCGSTPEISVKPMKLLTCLKYNKYPAA